MRWLPLGRARLVLMPFGISILFALVGASAASAAQNTYTLRPDGDVNSQWTKVGAATSAPALDDAVSQPSAVATPDYISSGGPGLVPEVSLATHPPPAGEGVSSGKAWFYAAAGLLSS